MNIQTLLGVFILVAIDNLNGRFLLVNVGDSDVEEHHRMGDPDVDDDNDDSRLGKIAVVQPSSNEEPRCKEINETCMSGFGCCSGLCKANHLRPEIGIDGVCVEKKDRPKKEGEACGQGCNDECGECEKGLECAPPATSPTCLCGVCLNILVGPGK